MKLAATVCPEAPLLTRTRLADYLELTKPRVAVLVLFTVAAGALLAANGVPDFVALLHTLCGTALVAGGASALNQLLERQTDALMVRTENRPLPAGRLQPGEVLVLGVALGLAGVLYLAATLRQPVAALIAAATFISYVFLYTPLKRVTPLNTLVGAVPGALPPVIGWAAMRGSIDFEVVTLFLILFLWQVPHFLAIAWIYREDYARAGLKMLPVVDREGGSTGHQMVTYCLALIPVSLTPVLWGLGGPLYMVGACVLGVGFLRRALGFTRAVASSRAVAWSPDHATAQGHHAAAQDQARRVLRASLVYLPVLLALLLLESLYRPVALALWP